MERRPVVYVSPVIGSDILQTLPDLADHGDSLCILVYLCVNAAILILRPNRWCMPILCFLKFELQVFEFIKVHHEIKAHKRTNCQASQQQRIKMHSLIVLINQCFKSVACQLGWIYQGAAVELQLGWIHQGAAMELQQKEGTEVQWMRRKGVPIVIEATGAIGRAATEVTEIAANVRAMRAPCRHRSDRCG
jgi:hypothetical protein